MWLISFIEVQIKTFGINGDHTPMNNKEKSSTSLGVITKPLPPVQTHKSNTFFHTYIEIFALFELQHVNINQEIRYLCQLNVVGSDGCARKLTDI